MNGLLIGALVGVSLGAITVGYGLAVSNYALIAIGTLAGVLYALMIVEWDAEVDA